MIYIVDNALQTSIKGFLIENWNVISNTVVDTPLQQVTTTYWLLSVASSLAQIQTSITPPQEPKLSVYAYLHSPLWKLNQALYLDAHILHICATLQDLLEAGHLHTVYSDYLSFQKLFTQSFWLDLDTLKCKTFWLILLDSLARESRTLHKCQKLHL